LMVQMVSVVNPDYKDHEVHPDRPVYKVKRVNLDAKEDSVDVEFQVMLQGLVDLMAREVNPDHRETLVDPDEGDQQEMKDDRDLLVFPDLLEWVKMETQEDVELRVVKVTPEIPDYQG